MGVKLFVGVASTRVEPTAVPSSVGVDDSTCGGRDSYAGIARPGGSPESGERCRGDKCTSSPGGEEEDEVDKDKPGGESDIDFGLSSSDCVRSPVGAKVGLLPGESSSIGERLLSRPVKFIPKFTDSDGEYVSDTGELGGTSAEQAVTSIVAASSVRMGEGIFAAL